MDKDFGHPRLRGGSSSQTAARILILLDVLGMPVGDPPPCAWSGASDLIPHSA